MKLRHFPAPILLQPTKRVEFPDRDVLAARELREFCGRCKGYALAANQVGIAKSYFVFAQGHDVTARAPWLIVNPEIIGSDGEFTYEETCLSLQELWPKGLEDGAMATRPKVTRPNRIAIRYQDQAGEAREFEASGLLGRVIWHELDHLAGKMYLDLLEERDRPAVEAVLRAKGLPVPWIIDESTALPAKPLP